MKTKFYASFNAIFYKLGHIADPSISIHLVQSIALPSLLYAVEVINLTKSELNSLEHSFNKVLFKIFKTSDKDNLKYCMTMYGLKSITNIYNSKKMNFLRKAKSICNDTLSNLLNK